MPKHEPMTPKAIANRIKSKGLQKLKWYCQMCQKQCRDENGYKCHTLSEAHQRQLLIFGENPNKFMDSFTTDFEKGYLDNLRRMHGTKRTFANLVYQDYIKDRDHIHMNATQWHTLSDFVQYLGKTGKCVVDHTEKGWFVTYIDRDPETLARQAKLAKMESRQLDDEERMQIALANMMERDAERNGENNADTSSSTAEFKRDDDGEKIALDLAALPDSKRLSSLMPSTAPVGKVSDVFVKPFSKAKFANTFKSDDDARSITSERSSKSKDNGTKKRKIDEYYEELKAKHANPSASSNHKAANANTGKTSTTDDDEPWLIPGIVVKIITPDLGESYIKRKAVVREVLRDRFTAIVELDSTTSDASSPPVRIKVDQTHVETVIPQLGRRVLFVRGKHRGQEAEMLDIDYDRFCVAAKLKNNDRIHGGEVIKNVAYDHISKVA